MSPPLHICISGLDGTGKTTQVGRLAERVERQAGKRTAIVTIWDLLLSPQTGSRIGFKSPAQVDAYLAIISSRSRHLFLFHCFAEAMALAEAKDAEVLISNAYWFKYYATEVAHGADAESARICAESIFPEPDLTFELVVDPADAYARKAQLSGYETGFSQEKSEEDFVGFQRRAQDALAGLRATRNWIEIDGTAPSGDVTDAIWKRAMEALT